MKNSKRKLKRTTVALPYDLWEELRIESIKRGVPMGELIAIKLMQLKDLKQKNAVMSTDEHGLLKPSEETE